MYEPMQHDDRTFYYAVGASLVFHALLLFALPGLREGRSAPEIPGVLVAHIVESPRAAPSAPQPVARPPEPPKPRIEPIKPPPVRKPSPLAERPVAPAPPPPTAESTPPSVEPAPAAPAASVPGPVARTEPAPGPAAPAAAELGSLGDYERALRIIAARYKRYPRVAVDNNWEGTVEVTMVVGANGIVSSITVKTSSGHRTLDDQAIEMFKRAKPLVPIPPALRGKEFTVVLRAIYSLKDPES